MIRTAPETGYDGGIKRHYRKNIWATFRREIGRPRCDAQALLMPSAEGEEVEVAIRNGFREEHLHLVDENAAIVAHLKRRFPRATCYGVRVSRAADRIAQAGIRIDIANLDLCGQIGSRETKAEIQGFLARGVMADESHIAVTMLRGREKHFQQLQENTKRRDLFAMQSIAPLADAARLDRLLLMIASASVDRGKLYRAASERFALYRPHLVRQEHYKSEAGSQTMLWAVVSLTAQSLSKTTVQKALAFHAETLRVLERTRLERGPNPSLIESIKDMRRAVNFYQGWLWNIEIDELDVERSA